MTDDKPALRREGRWLVWPDGYSVRAERITSVWPHRTSGTTCVTIDEPVEPGEYPWRLCPEGVTPAQVRALIDEALDEAAEGGDDLHARAVIADRDATIRDLVEKGERVRQALVSAKDDSEVKNEEIDRLRARVAELEQDKSVLSGELERHAKGYYHEESARLVAQAAVERDGFAQDADHWAVKYQREKEEVARLNAEIAAVVEPARALCRAWLDAATTEMGGTTEVATEKWEAIDGAAEDIYDALGRPYLGEEEWE